MLKNYLKRGLAILLAFTTPLAFGQKVIPKNINEKPKVVEQNAVADNVILDDLIVDGSACIGTDCVDGESFGFETIRMKENNLRVRFVDTSTTASFGTADWELEANSSSNGGGEHFAINDVDGGRTPFKIVAGAPTNSLYVSTAGRIGIGTANPVVGIHHVNGNSPTLRLEQDGSSGFTAQTWDIAGNEAGFFIRDATNGSALPFRIRPGSQAEAIFIADQNVYVKGAILPRASLPSDRRLKNNIHAFSNAQRTIDLLSPKTFTYDLTAFPDYGFPKGTQYGLIAQEVEKVLPDYVTEVSFPDGKRFKTVNYIGLIPILLQSNKEQQAEIEQLKAKISTYEVLESRLTALEAKLEEKEENTPLKTEEK